MHSGGICGGKAKRHLVNKQSSHPHGCFGSIHGGIANGSVRETGGR